MICIDKHEHHTVLHGKLFKEFWSVSFIIEQMLDFLNMNIIYLQTLKDVITLSYAEIYFLTSERLEESRRVM